jgi:hypothetical protein
MSPSAPTSENSAIVMIDHAVGFGNVFRSHDLSLHVNNTVGLAKTAGVFGIPLVLTNGADTGPYGPLFSELRAVTVGARVIVREGNFINAFQTPRFAAAIESAGRRKPVTWLSLASQYQGSYASHETVPEFLGLIAQHSPALGMLFQGQAARQAAPAASSPETGNAEPPDRCTGTRDARPRSRTRLRHLPRRFQRSGRQREVVRL